MSLQKISFTLIAICLISACAPKNSSAPASQPAAARTQSEVETPVLDEPEEYQPDLNHALIKCNFPNGQAEPELLSVTIDPEWSQVVMINRYGKILPPATGLKLQIDMKNTNPASYIWTMLNKDGKPVIQIQELAGDPPRYSILGRKPGTYDCYRQYSNMIDWYKRF